jgi:hypothetical protein
MDEKNALILNLKENLLKFQHSEYNIYRIESEQSSFDSDFSHMVFHKKNNLNKLSLR